MSLFEIDQINIKKFKNGTPNITEIAHLVQNYENEFDQTLNLGKNMKHELGQTLKNR